MNNDIEDFERGDHSVVDGLDMLRQTPKRAVVSVADAGRQGEAVEQGGDSARVMIESRNEFIGALRSAFAEVADAGCRELWLCDVNFSQWPLGEIAVVQELTRWAYAHRKLTLLAHDFDDVTRRHSRWVEWRRSWAHIVECRALPELEPAKVPTLLLAPGLVAVRLFDPVHYRGSKSSVKADMLGARELLDAVTQRSVEAYPATTLGL